MEKIRPLKPNLYLITGGGANTLVRVTPEGLIVVDTKNPGDDNFNRLMEEIRSVSPAGLGLADWPAAIGSVALATVAGFAVPVAPGGLGVRELVLWTSLEAVVDKDLAVLASLGLRMAWVAGEVLAGAALIVVRPPALIPDGTLAS